jgi:hypothetical protein
MRALVCIVVAGIAVGDAHAREREWSVSPSVEFGISNQLDSTGLGAAVKLQYGIRHWLAWRIAHASWHYMGNITDASAADPQHGVASRNYQLHRLHLLSLVVLEPPVTAQVWLRHVVPFLSFGAGLRTDLQIDRWTATPGGQVNKELDAKLILQPVGSAGGGIRWRTLRTFALCASARAQKSLRHLDEDWDVYVGLSFAVLFYWN